MQFKSRVNASGDEVNSLTLEVFGPVADLHGLLKKPLVITLVEENGPFSEGV